MRIFPLRLEKLSFMRYSFESSVVSVFENMDVKRADGERLMYEDGTDVLSDLGY